YKRDERRERGGGDAMADGGKEGCRNQNCEADVPRYSHRFSFS
ncbi:hypothetical protein Csa_023808, partial [Cucumis sativus]